MKDKIKVTYKSTSVPISMPKSFPQIWIQDGSLHIRLKNDAHIAVSQDEHSTVCQVLQSGDPYKTNVILKSGGKLI